MMHGDLSQLMYWSHGSVVVELASRAGRVYSVARGDQRVVEAGSRCQHHLNFVTRKPLAEMVSRIQAN